MESFSTWELRRKAGDRHPLSDEQIAEWQRWGLLRVPQDGRWTEADVGRAKRVRELGKEVRSQPRRAILLLDASYPTEPSKLREAMIAVVPTIKAPVAKMRRLRVALRVRYEGLAGPRSGRRQPAERWLPPKAEWTTVLRRFGDYEFGLIAGAAHADAAALTKSPAVVRSGALSGIPCDEVVVLLTIRQLAIGDSVFAASADS